MIPIQTTRFLGPVPHPTTEDWFIIGQDGGQSIAMGERTLFVFSDSLISTTKRPDSPIGMPCPFPTPLQGQGFFLPNCAGVTTERNLSGALAGLNYFEGEQGLPRPLLLPTEQEKAFRLRFWPEHGILIDGKVYLYYLGIKTIDPSSMWGFQNVGTGLAMLEPDTGVCTRLYHDRDWRLWRMRADDFHLGVQVIHEEEFLYVFASVREGVTSTARLARVRWDCITEPEAYQFLSSSKPTWTSRLTDACSLGGCSSDYSVSYNAYLGKYLMVYVDEYDKVLVLRTSDHIWGPFL